MNHGHKKPLQISSLQSELGKVSHYDHHYNPDRLCAISRKLAREEIGIFGDQLPFYGFDCWNHYEVSWLNQNGKPIVAIAEIIYDCSTPYLMESKSLKLYFNSFNNTIFQDIETVRKIIEDDLSARLLGKVFIKLFSLKDSLSWRMPALPQGDCIDDLDVTCSLYEVHPEYLVTEDRLVEETLYSDLLKSNCLITNQPDWGTLQLSYHGKKIKREGLLKYLVSFRNHNEFHEQCVERIFVDIMKHCEPSQLSVYGRYTRRGGLDINPFRTTEKLGSEGFNIRLIRQ